MKNDERKFVACLVITGALWLLFHFGFFDSLNRKGVTMQTKSIDVISDRGNIVGGITAYSEVHDGQILDTRISVSDFYVSGEKREEVLAQIKSIIEKNHL